MKIFLSSLIILLPLIGHSQNGYFITPESFDKVYSNVDISDTQWAHFSMAAQMGNNSEDTLMIDWEVIFTEIPAAWKILISDNNFDYTSDITSSQVPVDLYPQSQDEGFSVHVFPNGMSGCGEIKILISAHNTSEILDTIEYSIKINDDNCTTTGIDYLSLDHNKYLISPNPFNSWVELSGLKDVSAIEILDIEGRLIRKIPVAESFHIDLYFLPLGTYLLKIIEKSNIVHIEKVIKM